MRQPFRIAPQMYQQNKKIRYIVHMTYMRERAKRASASENNFSGLKILVTSAINVVPFYYIWYGAINDSIPTTKNANVEKIYEYASERAWIFFFSSYKKLLFLTYTINVVPPLLLMVWRYKWQYSNNKKLTLRKIYEWCERAERSSLENFRIFILKKLLFLSNILLVLQILSRYKWHDSKCTDKTPKNIIGGGGGLCWIRLEWVSILANWLYMWVYRAKPVS